ncbi:MAG: mechanosensitive ion channel, partial [Alphaproteobacteria bacterium]|nr:mechanosensitive ion channel [Alphaproteobacteria bacterium]
ADDIAPIILHRLSALGIMFLAGMLAGGLARYLADYPWLRLMQRLIWWRKRHPSHFRSLSNKSVLPSLREEVFSAMGFLIVYGLVGFWLDLDPSAHIASIALFGAAMAVRGLVILLHGVLSPDFLHSVLGLKPSPRRILKINRWIHSFIAVLVYGILGIGVLKLVDVPVNLRLIVIRLIGLALLILAYRALWQLHHFGRQHQQQVLARLSQMGEHMGGALGFTNLPFLHAHPQAESEIGTTRAVKPVSDRSNFESGEAPQTFLSPEKAKKTIFSRLIYILQQYWWLVAGFYLTIVYLGWAFDFHGEMIVFLKRSGVTLLVVWGAHWSLRAVDYYFGRSGILVISHPDKAVKSRFLNRLQRYLPLIRLVLRSGMVSLGILLALHMWNTRIIGWFLSGSRWVILTQLFSILMIIGVTILLWEFISAWIEQSLREHEQKINRGEHPKRARTILPLVRNVLLASLAISGGIFVLGQLGVHSNTILAGAGFISIGLGFGAQTIIRDIITGLFIVMEDTISIGELIEVDNVRGHVEAITLRNICLRDKDGALYTIPFNRVNAVANFSRDFSISHIVITVSRRNDAQKIFDILLEIDRELRATAPFDKLILEPLNIEGVENFSEKGVTIQAAQKTLPTRQYDV